MRCAALVGFLILASGGAFAAPSTTAVGPAIITRADQWAVWFGSAPASQSQSWEPNAGGDGVSVVDRTTARTPSGKSVDLTVKRSVSTAAIKAGLKTVVKGLIPGLTVAEAIWDMMRDHGVEEGPDGTGVIDPGQAEQPGHCYRLAFRAGACEGTGAVLSEREHSERTTCNANQGSLSIRTMSASKNNDGSATFRFSFKCVKFEDGAEVLLYERNDLWTQIGIPANVCPEVDSMLPVTGSAPCKSKFRLPVPDNVLDGYVTELPPDQVPDLAREVAKSIPGGITTEDQAPGVFGPPFVDDAPQTTTRPDGSIETKQRRWGLEYPGDGTVRFTPRIVETTPEGTTTTEGPAPGATESPSDCDKYPDIIGCSKYGTPEGGQVQKKTKTVSFDPVSLPGGGCPAPRQFTAFGTQYEISWTPICDATVTYVKPVVLIICSAFGAFIFIGGLKS